MPKKRTGEQEPMVTTKLSLPAHAAMKLLQRRYKADKPTLTDALWQFITEKDPELAREAEKVADLKEQLSTMLGEDEE